MTTTTTKKREPDAAPPAGPPDRATQTPARAAAAPEGPPATHPEAAPPVSDAELARALAAPFAAEKIGWKPQTVSGNRALAVAYIDARDVMDRLDETVGAFGWQDDYQENPDGTVCCRLSLSRRGEWHAKTDVGGESEQKDAHDRKKAAYSDALKRAAVKWGVGRYLYSLPSQWCDYDPQKRDFVRPPQLPAWALPGGRQVARPAPASPAAQDPTDYLTALDAQLAGESVAPAGSLKHHVGATLREQGKKWDAEGWALARKTAAAFEGQALLDAIGPLFEQKGVMVADVCKHLGVPETSMAMLPAAQLRQALSWLRSLPTPGKRRAAS